MFVWIHICKLHQDPFTFWMQSCHRYYCVSHAAVHFASPVLVSNTLVSRLSTASPPHTQATVTEIPANPRPFTLWPVLFFPLPTQVRKYLLLMDETKAHSKFWKPNMLVITDDMHPELAAFTNTLKKVRALVCGCACIYIKSVLTNA